MGPKPVRIGFKKKPVKPASRNDDFSDKGDELMSQTVLVGSPEEASAPLSASTMKVLKKIVDLGPVPEPKFLSRSFV